MRLSRLDLAVAGVAIIVVLTVVASLALIQPPSAPLRVAYLAPALRSPQNIWLADPTDPANVEQVTFSAFGVFDYAPSPDGRYIVYGERMDGTQNYHVDLMLLDLFNGTTQRLTRCADEGADCTTPVWRPDGQQLAFMRRSAGPAGTEPSRRPKSGLWTSRCRRCAKSTPCSTTTRPLAAARSTAGMGGAWPFTRTSGAA
ncbi:MAG: hypothetical protein MUF38_15720 [Anaerolineae bacterium]|nr:hypothetical protein [Anaerolineae bacterium]